MTLNKLSLLITIIGGINWGLVGAFKFDLIKFAFGFAPAMVPVAQVVIGAIACYTLFVYLIK